jgi:amidase
MPRALPKGLELSAADLAFAGVTAQRDLLDRHRLTATALVRCYLDRIARLDHQLRAFRTVFVDAALAEAEVADQRLATGERLPLLGIPIAVKDDIDVAGAATMWGTSVDNGPVAEDCEVVRRLRRAGAIIIGKTAMPELAMWSLTESSSWGITRNPWNADLSPGGSSGGSAAAVAAGLVPAAIGSDGGGSIRMPAAACGLFGMKAQRGRVSVMP